MITIYQYVADNNLDAAKAICNKYGYALPDGAGSQQVSDCLEQVVADDGSAPMYDIIALHPDKDIILQTYASSSAAQPGTADQKKCSCQEKTVDDYVNAAQASTGLHLQQGNILLIGAVLIVAITIIASSNK